MQKPSECHKRRRDHFFKIIHSTQDPCMVIPNKFIRIFSKELSNRVVLKVPSSKEWDIELREEEGRVSFQNGFQEFMEYYSIGRGHFLMFRYEGNSRFSVVICDMSASEICYPCDDADEIQEEDSVVVFKQNDVRQKKRKSFFDSKAQSPQQHLVSTSRPVSLLDEKKAIKKAKAFNSKYPFCHVRMRPSYVTYHFKLSLPMDFARIHLPGNPPISITLKVSDGRTWHVHCYSGISFFRLVKGWRKFVKDNQLLEDDICIFELVDEENWELKVSIIRARKDSKQKYKTSDKAISQNRNAICQKEGKKNDLKRKKIRLTDAQDTKKKRSEKLSSEIGYPCDDADQIQEEDSMVVLKQNDVRQKKMVGTSKPVSLQCKKMAMKLAKEFTSKHPFCYVLMCPSYVSYNFVLTLPLGFSQKYLQGYTQSQNITLLVSEGRTWKVNCSFTTDRVRLVKGWKKFVLDNELEVGDTCIFELVDREKRELKVSIFRVLEDSKQVNTSLNHSNSQTKDAIPQRKKKRSRYSDSSHSKKQPLQKISNLVSQATKDVAVVQRPLATQVKERSAKDPKTFKSKNPYCTITMRHTYVNSSFSLNVPKDFADLYLKDAFQGITLSLPNGGKWPISYCVGDHRKLLPGWKTFVVDNQLKEDDVCIFELVDSKNIELKVFIFPFDP